MTTNLISMKIKIIFSLLIKVILLSLLKSLKKTKKTIFSNNYKGAIFSYTNYYYFFKY